MPAMPSELLAEPQRIVCTAAAGGVPDQWEITVKVYADSSDLSLPMLLSPEQQGHTLNTFVNIVAGRKLQAQRVSFTLVLDMLEKIADRVLLDGDEVLAGPDGEPLVSEQWVNAYRTITRSRPADPAPEAGE